MKSGRSTTRSQYEYKALASGVTGELHRPSKKQVEEQGWLELPSGGGHFSKRVEKLRLDGLISFEGAYVEVGGSYDKVHDIHTSYACSVIEGLNVAEMVRADRVVARMSVYSPVKEYGGEHTFDITGSYFENLKIAGHKIELKLASFQFHKFNSCSKFTKAYAETRADDCLLFNKLGNLRQEKLDQLVTQYDALAEISGMITTWRKDTRRIAKPPYYCSAASHLNLQDHTGPSSEMEGYGAIICIPKFGVIRLAEINIFQNARSLTMLRVNMCSTGHGSTTGPTVGGGTPPIPALTQPLRRP